VLALPVSLSPKLRVTGAETEHMPFYLQVFFRVLSSWVHGEFSESFRGVFGEGLQDSPRDPLALRELGPSQQERLDTLTLLRPVVASAPPRWAIGPHIDVVRARVLKSGSRGARSNPIIRRLRLFLSGRAAVP
jgi:hypothetical protein